MSYTYNVKEEILNNEMVTNIEKKAEISAILLSKNAFCEEKIELRLENLALAKRVYNFIKDITDLRIEIKYSISKRLGEHNVYIILIPKQRGYRDFLESMKGFNVPLILASEDILKGFIRGIFLSCGYIKDPEKEYALDFFMDNEDAADKLYNLLLAKDKKVFKTMKRNKPLVYLRNSENIMDIMVLI